MGFHAELKGSAADLRRDFLLACNCIYMAGGKMAKLVKKEKRKRNHEVVFNLSHAAGTGWDLRFGELTW